MDWLVGEEPVTVDRFSLVLHNFSLFLVIAMTLDLPLSAIDLAHRTKITLAIPLLGGSNSLDLWKGMAREPAQADGRYIFAL